MNKLNILKQISEDLLVLLEDRNKHEEIYENLRTLSKSASSASLPLDEYPKINFHKYYKLLVIKNEDKSFFLEDVYFLTKEDGRRCIELLEDLHSSLLKNLGLTPVVVEINGHEILNKKTILTPSTEYDWLYSYVVTPEIKKISIR